jgi:hypothetical protein
LNKLWRHTFFGEEYRFQFLTKWNPNALIQPGIHGSLPLHEAIDNTSIQGFKMAFEYGIHYYPEKKGISLLFKKEDNNGDTPFQLACVRFGYEEVMEIIDDTLTRYSDTGGFRVAVGFFECAGFILGF